VAAHRVEEHLEGGAVEDVLARMDLVAVAHAVLGVDVEDGRQRRPELGEGFLDQPLGALRPGVEEGKASEPEKPHMPQEPQAPRGDSGLLDLVDGPLLPALGLRCTAAGAKASKAMS
jgi:hypothetical protein